MLLRVHVCHRICDRVAGVSVLVSSPGVKCDEPAYRRLEPFFSALLGAVVCRLPVAQLLIMWYIHRCANYNVNKAMLDNHFDILYKIF